MSARNHHYLSQCYLKGFTRGRSKKSKLSVIDLKTNKHFETTTRNVGAIRDFNRIEIPNIDPNQLETNLSKFESKVSESILEIESTHKFEGDHRENVLSLIATLSIRSDVPPCSVALGFRVRG